MVTETGPRGRETSRSKYMRWESHKLGSPEGPRALELRRRSQEILGPFARVVVPIRSRAAFPRAVKASQHHLLHSSAVLNLAAGAAYVLPKRPRKITTRPIIDETAAVGLKRGIRTPKTICVATQTSPARTSIGRIRHLLRSHSTRLLR